MTNNMPTEALTVKESRRLESCEQDIESGMDRINTAYQIIRDERLYRVEHETFEEYCKVRWNLTRQHINRLIRHEKVVANITEAKPDLEPIGSKMTEAATREIADLPPETQAEIVDKATDGGKSAPTAKSVRQARAEMAPKSEKGPVSEFFDGKGDKKTAKNGKAVSPAKIADQLVSAHISPLTRGLDSLAEAIGGKGENHEAADEALRVVLKSIKAMREGKQ